ncbi:protein Exd1 homolog [Eurosta solidaginis]|uniref:protein Exd1 homolog n=1 Tax=Eurosta solidaginis TaxID=178769 RepID=UPI0035315BBE
MEPSGIELQLGQQLLVQTSTELLTGRLKFVDPKRRIIELDNAYDQRSNCQYSSPQILAFPQIKKIQIIRDDVPSSDTNSCRETQQESDVSLSSTEMELINEQLRNIVCITQTDQRYHKALADIRLQPIVSLIIEPTEYGRVKRTSVLTIATFKTVYIFDIIALGNIFRELKQLLEAERPRKVVHYSHRMVDHLQNRYGFKLGGIFDTFVAVSLVQGFEKPMTLLEAIELTLNITPLYFQRDAEGTHGQDPYKRPLSVEMCQVLSKKAILQLKLHEHLLHKHMLRNFYTQCKNFSHTFGDSEDATTPLEMQRKSKAGFQHIKHNKNEFEFKFNELSLT